MSVCSLAVQGGGGPRRCHPRDSLRSPRTSFTPSNPFHPINAGVGGSPYRCLPCPAGQTTAGANTVLVNGNNGCTACPAGTFAPYGSADCAPCAPGFKSASGAAACSGCGNDYHVSTLRATSCTYCASGVYSPGSMSADFRLSSGAGNAFCMRCPGGQANQYALKSNSLYYSMEAMAAYRYNNLAGTTNQWNFVIGREYPCNGLCAAGTFSTATGVDAAAASCSACTLGTFSLQGAFVCLPCYGGTWATTAGTCTGVCAAGKFGTVTGATSSGVAACTNCPPGQYQPASGKSSCLVCPAGTWSAAGATSCTGCAPGFTSSPESTSVAACSACPAGRTFGTTGSACTACPVNTFSSSPGASSCSACPANSFALPGATSCAGCGAGQTYNLGGTGGCSSCLQGATHVSATLPCTPATNAYSPPTNTEFYFSGDRDEGYGALTAVGSASNLHYNSAGPFSKPGSALSLQAGAYLSVPSGSVPTLPSGNAASTVAAWVKCPADVLFSQPATVVEWGTPDTTIANTARYGFQVSAGLMPSTTNPSRFYCTRFSPVAGTATGGTSDDVVGTSAGFSSLKDITTDTSGNIFVIDGVRIRKVTAATGAVTTITGVLGTTQPSHIDGALASATFSGMRAIAVDSAGIIYVSDASVGNLNTAASALIRKISSTTVTTLSSVSAGGKGSADGTATVARFELILAMAMDNANGYIYIVDGARVRRVSTATGAVVTIAGGGANLDGVGTQASFNSPSSIVYDEAGALYVAEFNGNYIKKIVISTGAVTRWLGSSVCVNNYGGAYGCGTEFTGTGTSVMLMNPYKLAFDVAGGTLYFTPFMTSIMFRVDVATAKMEPYSSRITTGGSVYAPASGYASAIDGGSMVFAAVSTPLGAAGTVFILSASGLAIRRIERSVCPFVFHVCSGNAVTSYWRHLALTHGGAGGANNIRAYVDGQLIASDTALPYTIPVSSVLKIGHNGDVNIEGGNPLGSATTALISDVRVYASALTAAEVLALAAPATQLVSNSLTPPATWAVWASSVYLYCNPTGYTGTGTLFSRFSDGSYNLMAAACFPYTRSATASASAMATFSAAASSTAKPTVTASKSGSSSPTASATARQTNSAAPSSTAEFSLVSRAPTPSATMSAAPTAVPACEPGYVLTSAGSYSCVPCPGGPSGVYSKGGLGGNFGGNLLCAPCAAGSTWISITAGCQPPTALGATDTLAYWSGDATEGTGAFIVSNPSGVTYETDHFGSASSAATIASGTYFTIPQRGLPSGTSAVSSAAWVRCPTTLTSRASVIEWGAASLSANNIERFALTVTAGVAPVNPSGASLACPFSSSTNVTSLVAPKGIARDASTGFYIFTDGNQIKQIDSAGAVTVVAGTVGQGSPVNSVRRHLGCLTHVHPPRPTSTSISVRSHPHVPSTCRLGPRL